MNRTDRLYVFDFDDTLVRADGQIFVTKTDGSRVPVTPHQFYDYCLEPGETFDFTEFDEAELASNSIIIPEMWEIFEQKIAEHGQGAVAICTARSFDQSVINFLNNQGIHITVAAVGVHIAGVNTTEQNAIKKKNWIEQAIQQTGATHVEFWDDNSRNIHRVNELNLELPEVKIVTHHVIEV